MVKLLFQGVGCMAGCGLLWAGFFGGVVLLSECEYDPYAGAVPAADDAVVDGLEDMGKAEVAARLCPGNSLPPTMEF